MSEMSGTAITLLLCAFVIIVCGASYRRRGGSEAPANPRLAMLLAAIGIVLALVLASLLYFRRHVG